MFAARDIVQFVPFNKYRENTQKLTEKVLEEIPRQFIDYMNYGNILPLGM